MQTYVAEIEGRAIMAFRARNNEQAQVWVASEESIRSDLVALESQGRPLWDGKTELVVRAATIPEQAAWRKKSVELTEQDADHDPDDALVFLIPVTGPTPGRTSRTSSSVIPGGDFGALQARCD
jgi:hypothetical protein